MHWLTDPFQAEFMRRAFAAAILLGVLAPVVGTWIVLRRMANLGDAMSHGTLAGVGLAYAAGVNVVIGALGVSLVLAALLTVFSINRRLGQETIITIVGTALFAVGIIVIGRLDTGVDLSHFLFGRVFTVGWSDVWLSLALTVAALAVVAVLFRDLRLATFDPVHAQQVGVRVGAVQATLIALLAITVVISLRTVGLAMSSAMLVAPAASARLVAPTVRTMTLVGVCIGVSTAVVGLMLSYHLDAPPGATIALMATCVFAVMFAATLPRRMRHHHRPTL